MGTLDGSWPNMTQRMAARSPDCLAHPLRPMAEKEDVLRLLTDGDVPVTNHVAKLGGP